MDDQLFDFVDIIDVALTRNFFRHTAKKWVKEPPRTDASSKGKQETKTLVTGGSAKVRTVLERHHQQRRDHHSAGEQKK